MRPALLNPLFAAASGLKGVGPKVAKQLARLLRPGEEADAPARLVDLIFLLPVSLIDRRSRPRIAELPQKGIVTVEVTIGRHRPPPPSNRRAPYRIECDDPTGHITIAYFHGHGEQLRKLFPEGERRFVSGSIDWYQGTPQMVHPDHVVDAENFAKLPLIEPVYPLTEGLHAKALGRAIRDALERLPQMPEWQDAAWLAKMHWPAFGQALNQEHRPEKPGDISLLSPARARLAYDELLANQLALALVRRHMKRAKGRALAGTGELRARIVAALPYALTPSQRRATEEILNDMAAPDRMLRLLQGDVGSGKTVVALLALAAAAEAGTQGALMAPTEILARQHHATLAPLCEAAGIRLALLTGREKGRGREEIVDGLRAGTIRIVVGTHALFQEDVAFADLGLAVIDEQHRFGVHQRLALQSKAAGTGADLLVMTATPIPRTLALTAYGDMDVSKLTEKPGGRKPVDTRAMPMERLPEVIDGLGRLMAAGGRAYWVCPLVAESELVDLTAAEERFKSLAIRFPGKVALVHGRMKGAEKDRVMADFKSGAISLLVATTVIEVGVDVPEATVMVIEHAERFGLAQLHQLRGRVGRGAGKSSCLLLYQEPLGETARTRLSVMRETDDGFRIAEEDLRLRGAGEVLGTRQSGLPEFRLADLAVHGELLAAARDDAALILARDPNLTSARGEALRLLLYLFERDAAVKLLTAG
jgi:ATP-dependent DNA helicase RecG